MDSQDVEKDTLLARDIEIFKIVTEHFRQDIREFWTRANFFLLAHTGLFSAFVIAYPTLIRDRTMIAMSIPILGLVIAILWFMVLRSAVYWLQRWREQVIKISEKLDPFQCHVKVETFAKRRPFLQPAYVTQFLPLVFMITWLAILVLILIE